jgi:hypothetical protein
VKSHLCAARSNLRASAHKKSAREVWASKGGNWSNLHRYFHYMRRRSTNTSQLQHQ